MDKNTELELDYRKFEYELVNGKLNLNVARLDKLWLAFGGSILFAVASAIKTEELRLLYVFLPIILSVWLALLLYVFGQIERQKIVAVLHAEEINRILGKDVLTYDIEVMNKLWRYDKSLPLRYILLLNIVLLAPVVSVWAFTLYKGCGLVCLKAGGAEAFLYVGVSCFVLFAGIFSFVWARYKRKENTPLRKVIADNSVIET